MKGVKIKQLENKDLNELRDEIFQYLVTLLNVQSKSMAKLLEIFLEELKNILIEIHNTKPEYKGDKK